jgi:hypothetical protein
VKEYLEGDGLLLQGGVDDADPGRLSYVLRDHSSNRFHPPEKLGISVPGAVWSVLDLHNRVGFGLEYRAAAPDNHPFTRRWFVKAEQKWTPLETALGGDIKGVDRAEGIGEYALRVDFEARASEPSYFIKQGDRWLPATAAFPGLSGAVNEVKASVSSDILEVVTAKGRQWYGREASGSWKALKSGRIAEFPPKTPGTILSGIRSSTFVSDTLISVDMSTGGRRFFFRPSSPGAWQEANSFVREGQRVVDVTGHQDGQYTMRLDDGTVLIWVGRLGRFESMSELLGSAAPREVEDAFSFLGNRGLALKVRTASGGRTPNWVFWGRAPNGGSYEKLELLLHSVDTSAPTRIRAVYDFGTEGLAVQEEGDANSNGVPDEWFFYDDSPEGMLRRLDNEIPGSLCPTSSVLPFGGHNGITVLCGDHFVGHFLRGQTGHFRALGEELSLVDRQPEDAFSFWDGDGVAVRVGATADWAVYVRDGRRWRTIPGNWIPSHVREVQSDLASGLLAVKGESGSGEEASWSLRAARGDKWMAISEVHGQIDDVRVFPDVHRASLHRSNGTWTWLGLESRPNIRVLGDTQSPFWLGVSSTSPGSQTIQLADSVHYLDGKPTEGVPEPTLWLCADSVDSAGSAIRAPSSVPRGLLSVGLSPRATVILRRRAGRLNVEAFSDDVAVSYAH